MLPLANGIGALKLAMPFMFKAIIYIGDQRSFRIKLIYLLITYILAINKD